MRWKIDIAKEAKHGEIVSCVGFVNPEEVVSVADDHQILKWNLLSKETKQIAKLEDGIYPTDMHWFPRIGASSKKGSDLFVLCSTDGKFLLISRSGRVEKSVEAHRGAVLSARWSHDGTALVTGGEDGIVKVWSRNGMLRTTLSQNKSPIYSVDWSPNSDQILFTCGKQLIIKSLQANAKPSVWKAHDGLVLKVDWNPVNNMILSGAEDCKYKIWDSYGRLSYSSPNQTYPITSLSWSPDGSLFAMGSFCTLRLCDQAGWSHALEKPNVGSLFSINWSSDGTQVAAATGSGHVIFAHVIERRLEWLNYQVGVIDQKTINVINVINNAKEKLEFRDPVINVSINYKHLIVTTSSQCHIYSEKAWNTPNIFDVKERNVTLIIQCERYFLLVDSSSVLVYGYDGRLTSSPKFSGMRTNILSEATVSLSNDTVALRDQGDEKIIHLFETSSGKSSGDGKPFMHKSEICGIALDQIGTPNERHLAFVDKNRDLFLTQVRVHGVTRKIIKLGSMVQSILWNNAANILAALSDGKFSVWFYPNAAFVDLDLLSRTTIHRNSMEIGKELHLLAFHSHEVTFRRGEGSLVSTNVTAYPAVLHSYVAGGKWEDAIRLCRFVRQEFLWACLAAMAAYSKELATAEVAYAALDEADKVEFLQEISKLSTKDARNAEMAVFCGQARDGEAILLNAGLTFRAIMLNVTLFNWDRALELAVKHKTHVDTVLAYRQRYLENFDKKETNKRFLQYAKEITIDWDQIEKKISKEE